MCLCAVTVSGMQQYVYWCMYILFKCNKYTLCFHLVTFLNNVAINLVIADTFDPFMINLRLVLIIVDIVCYC